MLQDLVVQATTAVPKRSINRVPSRRLLRQASLARRYCSNETLHKRCVSFAFGDMVWLSEDRGPLVRSDPRVIASESTRQEAVWRPPRGHQIVISNASSLLGSRSATTHAPEEAYRRTPTDLCRRAAATRLYGVSFLTIR